MKAVAAVILSILLAGCAQTVFYRDGLPVARFQGDMTGVEYSDESIHWSAASVDHSSATAASGMAVTGVVTATGAAVAGTSYILR